MPLTTELSTAEIERYLKSVLGSAAHVLRLSVLGGPGEDAEIKGYGYGRPLLIELECEQERRRAVLHTVKPGPFGHEHMSDRAQSLLWDHSAFNLLPRHIRSIDVGAIRHDGRAVSLGDAEEFFILTDYAEGDCYVHDLFSLKAGRALTDLDSSRGRELARYLADIHKKKSGESGLYVRRIRELIGHSECIMGLIDSYPSGQTAVEWSRLQKIERAAVEWRWRLKNRTHRLCQVHGDFHPWNILFRAGTDFSVLDRSRGEWGEPADDVTCLSMNYLFFSLQQSGRLEGAFEKLFRDFWNCYLEATGDREILEVVAPFFAFRSLVMAHPLWYPDIDETVRRKILDFSIAVLDGGSFDPEKVNDYCGS